MMRRCGRCSAPLLPADGPSLLWSENGSRSARVTLHLRCWLAWQRPESAAPESTVTTAACAPDAVA